MNVVLSVVEKTFVCIGSVTNYAPMLMGNVEIQTIR